MVLFVFSWLCCDVYVVMKSFMCVSWPNETAALCLMSSYCFCHKLASHGRHSNLVNAANFGAIYVHRRDVHSPS